MAQGPPPPKPSGARPPFTVFLDRDGVFNRAPRIAVLRRRGLRWLPGAIEAFARLNRLGIQTCLVTNQPFLGAFMAWRVRAVHGELKARIEAAGGRLDRVEASLAPPWIGFLRPLAPRRLRRALRRRKPGPGMLEDGAAALSADRARAVMVGDKVKDAEAAMRFGIPAILLATTHPEATLRRQAARRGVPLRAVVAGLPEAVEGILAMAEADR